MGSSRSTKSSWLSCKSLMRYCRMPRWQSVLLKGMFVINLALMINVVLRAGNTSDQQVSSRREQVQMQSRDKEAPLVKRKRIQASDQDMGLQDPEPVTEPTFTQAVTTEMVSNSNKTNMEVIDEVPNAAMMYPVYNYKLAHPYATDPFDPDPMVYITSFTEIQPLRWHWMPEGSDFFNTCPNLQSWMRCHYTQNATEAELDRSHAVLFHARHMFASKNPNVRSFRELPMVRYPHQKWVFYESEAPTNTWNYADRYAPYWTLFNLTATYTMDSNIPIMHHRMTCRPRPYYVSTKRNVAQKKRLVAWFVNHCVTSSKREIYVDELMKYIPVDVYGECGNSTVCGKEARAADEDPDFCMMKLLDKKYKFYLSFESALCSHYVTEKFRRIINRVDIVPVVMGVADYVNILPQGSYIDVRDFPSPKDLALYLKELDENDDLYNRYIENKKSVECRPMLPFACTLCEYLHNHRYETQLVYNTAAFWSVEHRCINPRDFFRGIADDVIQNIHFNITPALFL